MQTISICVAFAFEMSVRLSECAIAIKSSETFARNKQFRVCFVCKSCAEKEYRVAVLNSDECAYFQNIASPRNLAAEVCLFLHYTIIQKGAEYLQCTCQRHQTNQRCFTLVNTNIFSVIILR